MSQANRMYLLTYAIIVSGSSLDSKLLAEASSSDAIGIALGAHDARMFLTRTSAGGPKTMVEFEAAFDRLLAEVKP